MELETDDSVFTCRAGSGPTVKGKPRVATRVETTGS